MYPCRKEILTLYPGPQKTQSEQPVLCTQRAVPCRCEPPKIQRNCRNYVTRRPGAGTPPELGGASEQTVSRSTRNARTREAGSARSRSRGGRQQDCVAYKMTRVHLPPDLSWDCLRGTFGPNGPDRPVCISGPLLSVRTYHAGLLGPFSDRR